MNDNIRTVDISTILNTNYKSYARYTLFERAIPSMIDGFKPVHRKIIYTARKSCREKTKVMTTAGLVIANGYNHGDMPCSSAIIKMAQDFVGTNNVPFLDYFGSFGSQLIPEAASPRYIYIKLSKNFEKFYNDFNICPKNIDLDYPEPQYYLPIIPTVLLNPIEGIAVGFATKIHPHKPIDLISNVINVLENKNQTKLQPFYKGYKGKIKWDEESQNFIMFGIYEIVNTTTINITEVPINFDREKYLSHIHKLIDKKLITSFSEDSRNGWNIKLKVPRKSKIFDNPIKHLKLSFTLNFNTTVLDENKNIKIYKNTNDLLKDFVEFRLVKYEERRQLKISEITQQIKYLNLKIIFIEFMSNVDFKTASLNDIKDLFTNANNCTTDELNKLLQIKATNLNKEEINKCYDEIEKEKERLDFYNNIDNIGLYKIDINALKKLI